MRNLFIIFSTFLFCQNYIYSQAENSKWYFGYKNGVDFTTNPPSELTDSNNNYLISNEGLGTISNKVTGQLLFYTNGITVWNRNHLIMSNSGNNGEYCYAYNGLGGQSGLIVPSVTNSNQFYVFSTVEQFGNCGGNFSYSIVDMTLNGGLGNVILNSNVNLLLPNGSPFPYLSKAISVVPNSAGNGYWILYPNDNNLYSYNLDSNGFHSIPILSNLPNNSTASLNYKYFYVKISPNNNLVAINTKMGFKVYDFNNFSGQLGNVLSYTLSDNMFPNFSRFEFSPNGNFIFLHKVIDDNENFIKVFDITNGMQRDIATPQGILLFDIQRTMNKVYIIKKTPQYAVPDPFLSEITNPNDFNTGITYNTINFTNDIGTPGFCLPPIIPKLKCALYEELKGNNINTNTSYQVSDHISTGDEYTVNINQNINLFANNYIELKSNTHLKSGSLLIAKIQSCQLNINRNSLTKNEDNNIENKITKNEKIIIYPNPTDDIVTFSMNYSKICNITINSILDNKTIITNRIEPNRIFQCDISALKKGIYIVNIVTDEGRTFYEKLIKN